jgi:hypothetical protein
MFFLMQVFQMSHGNSLHHATARRTSGLESSSSQQTSTTPQPPVCHLYPTYTRQYITNFNKQNSSVMVNWLECETISTRCEGWECKDYLHSIMLAMWDLGKVWFHGIHYCCGYTCLATTSWMYTQTQFYVYFPWCWWLLSVGIPAYSVLLIY